MRRVIDRVLQRIGYRLVPASHLELTYLHRYEGGYEHYRDTQIAHNKRKLEDVWADRTTLSTIVDDLKQSGLGASGICHGARNGFEVEFFRQHLNGEIIGTDISETAANYPNMVTWDFQDENPEWAGRFDFVYTNSLDQAMSPERALAAWSKQLANGGKIYVEHSMSHSPKHAGEMDPFGAHPLVMPYLFFIWGRSEYQLADIIEIEEKENKKSRAWVFVLQTTS